MLTSASNISVVLSGGAANLNPNLSLGGESSSSPVVSGSLNNLFSDVSATDSENGIVDYRCIYYFNDGDTTIYQVKIWLSQDLTQGDGMALGVLNVNEIQRITIGGSTPTGGTLTLSYLGHQFTVNYTPDLGQWALSIQNALNGLVDTNGDPLLNSVTVAAQTSGGGTIVFSINFVNKEVSRSHQQITVGSNNLTPNGTVTVIADTPRVGSPINTVASQIDVATTTPGGVNFFAPTQQIPITLPFLRSNEGFPIWIQRVIPAGATAMENDGFSIRFQAQSLDQT